MLINNNENTLILSQFKRLELYRLAFKKPAKQYLKSEILNPDLELNCFRF
jgi:hypothetical protein